MRKLENPNSRPDYIRVTPKGTLRKLLAENVKNKTRLRLMKKMKLNVSAQPDRPVEVAAATG